MASFNTLRNKIYEICNTTVELGYNVPLREGRRIKYYLNVHTIWINLVYKYIPFYKRG